MKVKPIIIDEENYNIVLLPVPLINGKNLFKVSKDIKVSNEIEIPDEDIDSFYFSSRKSRDKSTDVLLIVNDICNFNCIYCFETNDYGKIRNNSAISTEIAFNTIDWLISNAVDQNNETISVSFFGG